MANFNFPEEILLLIFEKLPQSDQITCQQVCRPWYSPARISTLNEIRLIKDASKIEKFITFIDLDQDPKYLNAVKEIYIDMNSIPISMANIYKLLFRFPNVTSVSIDNWVNLFEECTDEMCTAALAKCPKLKQFEVLDYHCNRQFYVLLYNVRLLVTSVDLYTFNQQRNVVQYLTGFPRLQTVCGTDEDFNNFRQLLQVIQELPDLTAVTMNVQTIHDRFMESYLATKSRSEQEILLNRLANVTDFYVTCPHNLGLQVTQFFIQYFTGLKDFQIYAQSGERLTDEHEQQQVFCDNITELIHRAKNTCEINLEVPNPQDWKSYITIIQNKAYFPTVTLRLKMEDARSDDPTPDIRIKAYRRARQMHVRASQQLDLHTFTSTLFTNAPLLDNIDALFVEFSRDYDQESNSDMYTEVLDKLPKLKKVAFDIPQTYQTGQDTGKTYPLVEELRLKVHPNLELRPLLKSYAIMFPNLKHLDLFDFRSRWKEDTTTLCVNLSNYSLERLTMDFAPMITKSYMRFKGKHNFQDQEFCVVELIFSNKKYLYKLTLQQLSAKPIVESDLIGHKDYVRVELTMGSLQRLDIYYTTMFRMIGLDLGSYQHSDDDDDGPYGTESVPHVTLFNNK